MNTEDVLRERIAVLADSHRRLTSERAEGECRLSPSQIEQAVTLATEWAEVAAQHGISLRALDLTTSVALDAFNAVLSGLRQWSPEVDDQGFDLSDDVSVHRGDASAAVQRASPAQVLMDARRMLVRARADASLVSETLTSVRRALMREQAEAEGGQEERTGASGTAAATG